MVLADNSSINSDTDKIFTEQMLSNGQSNKSIESLICICSMIRKSTQCHNMFVVIPVGIHSVFQLACFSNLAQQKESNFFLFSHVRPLRLLHL